MSNDKTSTLQCFNAVDSGLVLPEQTSRKNSHVVKWIEARTWRG